jgi:hypothetical protein
MEKTHSKPLAARHAMCESAFNVLRAQAVLLVRGRSKTAKAIVIVAGHRDGLSVSVCHNATDTVSTAGTLGLYADCHC